MNRAFSYLTVDSLQSSFNKGDLYLLAGIGLWVALIQISIAAAQLVLATLICIWFVLLNRGRFHWVSLPINKPLALYAGLSLLAAFFSFDPMFSLHESRKLLLLIVPYFLVSTINQTNHVERLIWLLIIVADLSAILGLWQYHFEGHNDLDHRITGFMSHYMTYSGLLMGVSGFALSQLLFGRKHRVFLFLSLILIVAALVLTLTRSAWIGVFLASLVLIYLKDKRLLLLAPLIVASVTLILPNHVEHRFGSFITPDSSGWDRIYMLRAGVSIVENHPWFGVGLNNVGNVYPIYRIQEAPDRANMHLHNNIMQIAAERGIPCLFAWLWLMTVCFIASMRRFLDSKHDPKIQGLAAGSMGILIASFLAGLFEFNFGDSEFQMLLLLTIAIPWMVSNNKRAVES